MRGREKSLGRPWLKPSDLTKANQALMAKLAQTESSSLERCHNLSRLTVAPLRALLAKQKVTQGRLGCHGREPITDRSQGSARRKAYRGEDATSC
jgi:hypothetical protein